jgi:hypothetical protein
MKAGLLFSTLNVLASIVVALAALMAKWLGCGDEGCRGSTWDWTENDYSWQWSAIVVLGLAILAAALLLAWLVRSTAPSRHAAYALAAQAIVAGLLLLTIAGSDLAGPFVILGVLTPVLFGAASVALQRDARRL